MIKGCKPKSPFYSLKNHGKNHAKIGIFICIKSQPRQLRINNQHLQRVKCNNQSSKTWIWLQIKLELYRLYLEMKCWLTASTRFYKTADDYSCNHVEREIYYLIEKVAI